MWCVSKMHEWHGHIAQAVIAIGAHGMEAPLHPKNFSRHVVAIDAMRAGVTPDDSGKTKGLSLHRGDMLNYERNTSGSGHETVGPVFISWPSEKFDEGRRLVDAVTRSLEAQDVFDPEGFAKGILALVAYSRERQAIDVSASQALDAVVQLCSDTKEIKATSYLVLRLKKGYRFKLRSVRLQPFPHHELKGKFERFGCDYLELSSVGAGEHKNLHKLAFRDTFCIERQIVVPCLFAVGADKEFERMRRNFGDLCAVECLGSRLHNKSLNAIFENLHSRLTWMAKEAISSEFGELSAAEGFEPLPQYSTLLLKLLESVITVFQYGKKNGWVIPTTGGGLLWFVNPPDAKSLENDLHRRRESIQAQFANPGSLPVEAIHLLKLASRFHEYTAFAERAQAEAKHLQLSQSEDINTSYFQLFRFLDSLLGSKEMAAKSVVERSAVILSGVDPDKWSMEIKAAKRKSSTSMTDLYQSRCDLVHADCSVANSQLSRLLIVVDEVLQAFSRFWRTDHMGDYTEANFEPVKKQWWQRLDLCVAEHKADRSNVDSLRSAGILDVA